jgi:hypothetical protein
VLQNGARISAATYGDADGGKVTIKTFNSLKLFDSTISASSYAEGDAGSLKIETPQLLLIDGGILTSSTIGTGAGGEIMIDVDSIEVTGVSSKNGKNQRSNISASSFNAGDAGNLKINTAQLRIRDGASVSSSAFATGNAGSLTIDAFKSIEVSGTNNNFQSRIGAAVELTVSEAARKALKLPEIPSGCSGNLIVNTPHLNINSGGSVSVSNKGTGNASSLNIKAEVISLDTQGSISANALSGNGGKIDITAKSLLRSPDSQITAKSESGIDGTIAIEA